MERKPFAPFPMNFGQKEVRPFVFKMPKNLRFAEEYPAYTSLFQNKAVLLSSVYRENINLGHAVRRLVKDGVAQGIKVTTNTGKRDILVSLMPIAKPDVK
mgnify:CR=1 FL=1